MTLSGYLKWLDSLVIGHYDKNKLVYTYDIIFSMLIIPWKRQYHLQETSNREHLPEALREILFCSISIDDYKNKHIFLNVLNISSTEIQLHLHICWYILSARITIYLLS